MIPGFVTLDTTAGAAEINPAAIASIQQVQTEEGTQLLVVMLEGERFTVRQSFGEFVCACANAIFEQRRGRTATAAPEMKAAEAARATYLNGAVARAAAEFAGAPQAVRPTTEPPIDGSLSEWAAYAKAERTRLGDTIVVLKRAMYGLHTLTAAYYFGVAPDAVTPEQRLEAKRNNFGGNYGARSEDLQNFKQAQNLAQRDLAIARDCVRQLRPMERAPR